MSNEEDNKLTAWELEVRRRQELNKKIREEQRAEQERLNAPVRTTRRFWAVEQDFVLSYRLEQGYEYLAWIEKKHLTKPLPEGIKPNDHVEFEIPGWRMDEIKLKDEESYVQATSREGTDQT